MKQHLRHRVDSFNVNQWARAQRLNPGRPLPHTSFADHAARLHNPYAGVPYAWQLTETVDDFLARLPPATTVQDETIPWIFICNPYIPRLQRRHSDGACLKTNEDEGPAEENSRLQLVVQGGMERLELLSSLRDKLERAGKSQAVIKREMSKEAKQATLDILNLAHAGKVRTGKVRVFSGPDASPRLFDSYPGCSGWSFASPRTSTKSGSWWQRLLPTTSSALPPKSPRARRTRTGEKTASSASTRQTSTTGLTLAASSKG